MRVRGSWAVVALALVGGCADKEKREEPPPAATGAGQNLYDLPEMKRGRVHRDKGSKAMQDAYRSRDPLQRENAFATAWESYKLAEDAYHDALTTAAPRYRPTIEREIASVAEYMRQIQRDRAPAKQ